jgi:hypothetical protein
LLYRLFEKRERFYTKSLAEKAVLRLLVRGLVVELAEE